MKKFYFLFLLFASGDLLAQTTYVYHFNNSLNEQSSGPALVDTLTCGASSQAGYSSQTVCSGGSKAVLNFNAGEGLVFENSSSFIGPSSSYTINMLMKFNSLTGTGNPSGAQRIINFDTASDNGIYELSGGVGFFSGGDTVGAYTITANNYFLFTVVRDGTDDSVFTYLNGALSERIHDPGGLYAPPSPTNAIFFFVDDNDPANPTFHCEDGPGSVSYISISNSASTATDILSTYSGLCPSILPLQLLDFHGAKQNNTVALSWTTTNEVNTSYFEVERGNDGTHYNTLATVTSNNTRSVNNYSYIDQQPSATNFYRLKMIDIDGVFKYSAVLKINFAGIQKLEVFPNPAKDVLTISGTNNKELVKLISADGKLLLQKRASGQSMTMDISNLLPGIYILQYFDGTGLQNKKIIKE